MFAVFLNIQNIFLNYKISAPFLLVETKMHIFKINLG